MDARNRAGYIGFAARDLIDRADAARARCSDSSSAVTGSEWGRSADPMAVVSRSVAERLFGVVDATGRYLRIGTAAPRVRISGIAADATLGDPRTPRAPTVYLNFWEQPASLQEYPVFVIRTELPSERSRKQYARS